MNFSHFHWPFSFRCCVLRNKNRKLKGWKVFKSDLRCWIQLIVVAKFFVGFHDDLLKFEIAENIFIFQTWPIESLFVLLSVGGTYLWYKVKTNFLVSLHFIFKLNLECNFTYLSLQVEEMSLNDWIWNDFIWEGCRICARVQIILIEINFKRLFFLVECNTSFQSCWRIFDFPWPEESLLESYSNWVYRGI